ncbi:hypothetical protein GIB67_003604, partial [Kingdonia uniflora]
HKKKINTNDLPLHQTSNSTVVTVPLLWRFGKILSTKLMNLASSPSAASKSFTLDVFVALSGKSLSTISLRSWIALSISLFRKNPPTIAL